MQVKLTKVSRTTTDKTGDALKTKDGRPYTRLSIKTNEHGDKFLSGFENQQTSGWKEGDTVEIDVIQNGEYLNFKVPKAIDKVDEKLELLLNKVTGLQLSVGVLLDRGAPKKTPYPENIEAEPSPDDEPGF